MSVKIGLITAGCLVGAGLLTTGITFAVFGFDPSKLSTTKYVTNTYNVDGKFSNINIEGDTEDIIFEKASDGVCKVVCKEEDDRPHIVTVEGDTLSITREKKLIWSFGINFESPKMTVYLPEDAYGDIKVDSDTGDLDIPAGFSFDKMAVRTDTGDVKSYAKVAENINISTDTGDMELKDITAATLTLDSDTGRINITNADIDGDIKIKEDTGDVFLNKVICLEFESKGDTSDLTLKDVLATGGFNITRSTGDVRFDACDAASVYVKTSTGDVEGTFLTDKVYITDTHTGRVDVPKTSEGGRCEITTDTGDIKIKVG